MANKNPGYKKYFKKVSRMGKYTTETSHMNYIGFSSLLFNGLKKPSLNNTYHYWPSSSLAVCRAGLPAPRPDKKPPCG